MTPLFNSHLSLQVVSIRDVQKARKVVGTKIKKVLDLQVTYDQTTSFIIQVTQKKLQKLTQDIKKELNNIELHNVNITSHSSAELQNLLQIIGATPKIARSMSVAKFLEREGNKVMSRAFITDEFIRDNNHQGVLDKIKKKQKLTKKERFCFIKYNRILYYYTLSKEVKGAICLDDCAVSVSKSNNNGFELQTPHNGHYLFCAKSASECDQWVQAIRKCIDVCKESKKAVNGTLSGSIIKGRDLAKKDLNGFADPFAITRIERQQSRTPTIYKTLNPTWNEPFAFDITKNDGYFYLLVWDEDKFTAADFMGKVVIPLTALQPGQDVQLYLPLIPKAKNNTVTGDVSIRLKYVYTLEHQAQQASTLFGQSLAYFETKPELCKDGLPSVLYDFVNFFEQHGLKEEGLFRVCGSSLEIKMYKQHMNAGQPLKYEPNNIHSLAGVFKLFFRELPEPILTFDKYDAFLALAAQNTTLKQISTLVKALPRQNQKLLQLLLPFFHNIGRVENSKYNMMNFSNLAIVFGPAMLRPMHETNEGILKLNLVNEITRKLIEYGPSIFESST
ncbi:hypothetical protein SAMD00019534_010540 [Acytostelium subglobosum LB1]|uniref:hypothetical protein n=1 Tax=Acytostelium subglobosum LB1 TaxID=1410327 RepID=UPI000644AE1B|nr:hypothetical protein SAMD00019534_010540 [Acytostelium subglobosum LB1]GAM17879.1 hypothetical protein SAMD00019534_010540 [Acytostelium subglobosum LB1]|eukprot:XP_012758475.1 hypothetical protein SAMD00019534_010540 [Acytostelium subglobosum LB1]